MTKDFKKKEFHKLQNFQNELNNETNPVTFSFYYALNDNKYSLNNKKIDKALRLKLLSNLCLYSSQSWEKLTSQNKYDGGVEYIARDKLKSLKVKIPKGEFYDKIKRFTIFRTNDLRIAGYRDKNTCYILWIDWDFTSYDHGS